MPLRLRFDRFQDDDSKGQAIVSNWCNDDQVTQFMATGRSWVSPADAGRLWGGRHSFLVYVGPDWWEQAEAVGVVGLFDHDLLSEKAELRILMGHLRGEGLGTQIVMAMLEYGFAKLGLWRIYLGTARENEAAVRCFHRCGFRDEGVLVDDLKRDGKRMTNVRMAILRSQWGCSAWPVNGRDDQRPSEPLEVRFWRRVEHLFLGTDAENAHDMWNKGRGYLGGGPKGEDHGCAKLTVESVREIRSSPLGCNRLARRYGVSRVTIKRIRQGRSWRSAL